MFHDNAPMRERDAKAPPLPASLRGFHPEPRILFNPASQQLEASGRFSAMEAARDRGQQLEHQIWKGGPPRT